MADKTTNLQLQKIDNTDYAGNFPTIYNNNLDLIDGLKSDLITSVAGKQDKLIAGSGITIASDGKTISSSGGKWVKINNISDISNYINVTENQSTFTINITKNLKFNIMHFPNMTTIQMLNNILLSKTSFHCKKNEVCFTSGTSLISGSDRFSCYVEFNANIKQLSLKFVRISGSSVVPTDIFTNKNGVIQTNTQFTLVNDFINSTHDSFKYHAIIEVEN